MKLEFDTADRAGIPAAYKWRMEDIFKDKDAYQQALTGVEDKLAEVTACAGRLEEPGILESCLRLYAQLNEQLEKVYMYAKMILDLDNASAAGQAMHDGALNLLFRVQEETAFLLPELTAMESDTLRQRVGAAEDLQEFQRMVEEVIRSREHVLSAREEQLLAMASPALESMDTAFSMLDSVDLKRGEITDEEGNAVTLTNGLFGRFRESHDRRVREEAFRKLHEAYAGMGNTIAALYAGQVRADVFGSRVRNYADSLDAALFSDALPREIYTNLIRTVRAALPAYYRYLELRRRVMGLEELHIYDCFVPIVETPRREYSYEESCELVKRHLSPLGQNYRQDLDRLLAGGWVDVFETPGKTTGAYATGVYGVHPYMLLNFTGELGDVFTLAHEAGHCLHTYYSDSQPYMLKDYPIFLAEIASTVNENILLRGMLADCDDSTEEGRREKAILVNRYLEEFRGTVYRQTMFAEFELKVHEMAERGEPLTAESMCQVYHELLRDYFGPDVVIDPYMDWEWARIPHFYNAFYVFKYATGFSAAAAITRRILHGEGLEDYLRFLHAGGSDYPAETLKRAGVDMSTPEPVEAALQEFADMAAELEKLLG